MSSAKDHDTSRSSAAVRNRQAEVRQKRGVAAAELARRAPAAGHLPAAWRVYTGMADCCVATRSAARAFGLDFVPLASERYDLVIRSEHLGTTAVERLLDTLAQAAFRRELEALCGYDTAETGKKQL